jgi:hypothetical protein
MIFYRPLLIIEPYLSVRIKFILYHVKIAGIFSKMVFFYILVVLLNVNNI